MSVREPTDHGVPWSAILAAFGNRCAYCGIEAHRARLTKDHVVPLSRGGSNALGNVVPACHACNSAKGSSMTWQPRQPTYPELLVYPQSAPRGVRGRVAVWPRDRGGRSRERVPAGGQPLACPRGLCMFGPCGHL